MEPIKDVPTPRTTWLLASSQLLRCSRLSGVFLSNFRVLKVPEQWTASTSISKSHRDSLAASASGIHDFSPTSRRGKVKRLSDVKGQTTEIAEAAELCYDRLFPSTERVAAAELAMSPCGQKLSVSRSTPTRGLQSSSATLLKVIFSFHSTFPPQLSLFSFLFLLISLLLSLHRCSSSGLLPFSFLEISAM